MRGPFFQYRSVRFLYRSRYHQIDTTEKKELEMKRAMLLFCFEMNDDNVLARDLLRIGTEWAEFVLQVTPLL